MGILSMTKRKTSGFTLLMQASDELIKDRKKFYDATKAEMAKQRYGLNEDSNTPYEDRTMKRAWTTFDANHIKEIIVELYSSLDDTSKQLTILIWALLPR
jgi:hypothetical protein